MKKLISTAVLVLAFFAGACVPDNEVVANTDTSPMVENYNNGKFDDVVIWVDPDTKVNYLVAVDYVDGAQAITPRLRDATGIIYVGE